MRTRAIIISLRRDHKFTTTIKLATKVTIKLKT